MRLHCFVVIKNDEVGVGFCSSWSRRDKIVIAFRKDGHIAQMIRRDHPYAKWLRSAVEYNETLDGQVIRYGTVFSENELTERDKTEHKKMFGIAMRLEEEE